MKLPFRRRKKTTDFKGIRSRSMLVESAEVDFPAELLRRPRTLEESRAARARIERRRAQRAAA